MTSVRVPHPYAPTPSPPQAEPRLIPGRESHTADLDAFDRYIYRLLAIKRPRISDSSSPYNEDFWKYVRTLLESAKPVGFDEVSDPNAVVAKSPKQCGAFMDKIRRLGDVTPMHPAHLAKRSGFDHNVVLEELLYATRVGLVSMMWAPECSRCGCAVVLESNITSLPSEMKCEVCSYPNTIDTLDHVMVTFILCEDVLYLPSSHPFGCRVNRQIAASAALLAPVPATSTGSGFRYCVGCDGQNMLRPALEPGKYRLVCPYSLTDLTIEVKKGTGGHNVKPYDFKMWVSDAISEESHISSAVVTLSHGQVRFDVLPDTHSFFFLTLIPLVDDDQLFILPKEERITYTTATEVMHHRVFQDLFSNQIVGDRLKMQFNILHAVVVVMGVVGATELCTRLGDGPALRATKKYCEVVSCVFSSHGRIVRKDGSAVIIGSFTTGRAAIEAAAQAMSEISNMNISSDEDWPLEVRAAIHCGPTLMVPVNGTNDYFGRTVSIAADVMGAAKANECLVTDAVLTLEPEALAAFRNVEKINGAKFELERESSLRVQGIPEAVRVSGFRIKESDGEKKGRAKIPFMAQSLQSEINAGHPYTDPRGRRGGKKAFLQKSLVEGENEQAGEVDGAPIMSFLRKTFAHESSKSTMKVSGKQLQKNNKNPAA